MYYESVIKNLKKEIWTYAIGTAVSAVIAMFSLFAIPLIGSVWFAVPMLFFAMVTIGCAVQVQELRDALKFFTERERAIDGEVK